MYMYIHIDTGDYRGISIWLGPSAHYSSTGMLWEQLWGSGSALMHGSQALEVPFEMASMGREWKMVSRANIKA